MTAVRVILHGKAAGDARVRTAVHALRREGHLAEVRVTWEPRDATRLTAEAAAEAANGKIDCIVAGGGDGTINEVFAAAYAAGLPTHCSLGVLPLGTANDFARSAGVSVTNIAAALRIAANAPPRLIDLGLLDGTPFVNLVSGGFGSRVTVETNPELKRRLGGLAYAITGVSRFAGLSANRGTFRAEGFSWEGPFLALAIGNGRQAGGGVPLCPHARIDDGLLDLTILPDLDSVARFDAFSRHLLPSIDYSQYLRPNTTFLRHLLPNSAFARYLLPHTAFSRLLRKGEAVIRAEQVTARSPWIEYESEHDLNINLDGEPRVTKRFRVECRKRLLPVRLGKGAFLSSHRGQT